MNSIEIGRKRPILEKDFVLFRYSTNKVKFTDYHFGSPVMRLLYLQNKIDLALQLYMDEVKIKLFLFIIRNCLFVYRI